jgi:uracil permease
MALLIKLFSAKKIMRYFPPIVTGPIIIAIGLTLSQSAIDSCSSNWIVALVAVVAVVICNIFGKGMIKIIPILIGVVASYIVGIFMGEVDFTAVKDAAWIGLPIVKDMTVFGLFGENFDVSKLITAVITIMPIALATIVEHIGDISAISSTTGINYIKNPGLHRTLLSDGISTMLSGCCGSVPTTTYGENIGVMAVTKVYSVWVIGGAAVFSILLAFFGQVSALISTIPGPVMGGISFLLYGMIAASGIRLLVDKKVDYSKPRNLAMTAVVFVTGLSGAAIKIGEVQLTGMCLATIVGIVMGLMMFIIDKTGLANDKE